MAVPTEATYSVTALVDAQTSLLDLIDTGISAGKIKIRDASDVLLATITLTDPAGTVAGGTGVLTITPAGTAVGLTDSTAAYGEITDSNDNIILSLPAAEGVAAVSGYIVISSLTILTDGVITVQSVVIG